MTARSRRRDYERQRRREARQQALIDRALADERQVAAYRQIRAQRAVMAHQDEHPYLARLIAQLAADRPLTPGQVGVVYEIAQERDLPIPGESPAAAPKSGGRQTDGSAPDRDGPADWKLQAKAAEAARSYFGDDEWLRWMRQNPGRNPAWVPTVWESKLILARAGRSTGRPVRRSRRSGSRSSA